MKVKLNGNDWYRLTSDFGAIDSAHKIPHNGIDIAMPTGTPILSPIDGVVKSVVDYGDKNIGKGVLIETSDGNTLILGHLSEAKVEVGQHIQFGDLVALSGNTGRSTGAHLHVGIQNGQGKFIDPENHVFQFEGKGLVDRVRNGLDGTIDGVKDGVAGFTDGVKGFMDFIDRVGEVGLFQAIYGKSFFEVVKDFFAQLAKDIGVFILSHSDVFFLTPAILFMLATFFVGRNRFTKYIIPLWFLYFLGLFFHKLLIS